MDTKQYVDTLKIPLSDVYTCDDGEEIEFRLHPLPILTCEDNGGGSGDYHKEDPLIGSWARNRVSVARTIPKGYTELKCKFFEGKKPFRKPKKVPTEKATA